MNRESYYESVSLEAAKTAKDLVQDRGHASEILRRLCGSEAVKKSAAERRHLRSPARKRWDHESGRKTSRGAATSRKRGAGTMPDGSRCPVPHSDPSLRSGFWGSQ